MPKKIVIVTAVFPPEQVTSAFLNYDLAHELAKDYEVVVLRPYPTRPKGAVFSSVDVGDTSFKTILINSYTHPESKLIGRFRESIDFGRKSAKYIKKHHSDIAFVYNDGWQLFGLYLVAKICKKFDIPYIVPIQDIYPESLLTNKNYPNIIGKLIKTILLPIDRYYQKQAACVRTISNDMRDYLSQTRNIPKEAYLVVNNWQNDEDFLREYPERPIDDKIVFAYAGSINSHSNVDLMIRAFADAAIPNSEFRVYGGGNKKEDCENLANELGLTNVVFDYVSRNRIAFVQSQADVLVLALPKGNGNLCLPSKLTSYMLSGKPVLASVDSDCLTSKIIKENECGISVMPDDISALKRGFVYFSQQSHAQLVEKGRRSKLFSDQHLTREVNLHSVVKKIYEVLR